MAISLRPYQIECLETIAFNRSAGIHRQVVHLPTAAGKTVIFGALIDREIETDPSIRALVLAFSTDLLGQARDKFLMINPGLDVGIVDADHKEFSRQVVLSSIQSARQPGNLEKLQAQKFSIAICDECHHFASDSARLVLGELGFTNEGCAEGNRLLIGCSATPFRTDGRGLGEIFDKIVYHRSVRQMIDDGYLCPPKGHKVLTDLDVSKVAVENGDFSPSALSKVMNTDPINETVVRSYLEKAAGRKTVAFATSIDHAVKLAEWFRRFGIFAEAIHSDLSIPEREAMKKRFRDGGIEVLVNPLMLTEGFDEASVSAVIITRPTKSLGLYQQMAGRGLRLYPNKKDCIILDFGDQAHSLAGIEMLLGEDTKKTSKRHHKNTETVDLVGDLPQTINPKLKKAILDFDLLGESFTWQKDFDGQYLLKSSGGELKIIKRAAGLYDAILFYPGGSKTIAAALDFEYAFSAAEDFAKSNRALFAVSDLEAPWRKLPISEKQKDLFRSVGFRSGIDSLSRGQAAMIIGSGIFRKRKSANGK